MKLAKFGTPGYLFIRSSIDKLPFNLGTPDSSNPKPQFKGDVEPVRIGQNTQTFGLLSFTKPTGAGEWLCFSCGYTITEEDELELDPCEIAIGEVECPQCRSGVSTHWMTPLIAHSKTTFKGQSFDYIMGVYRDIDGREVHVDEKYEGGRTCHLCHSPSLLTHHDAHSEHYSCTEESCQHEYNGEYSPFVSRNIKMKTCMNCPEMRLTPIFNLVAPGCGITSSVCPHGSEARDNGAQVIFYRIPSDCPKYESEPEGTNHGEILNWVNPKSPVD